MKSAKNIILLVAIGAIFIGCAAPKLDEGGEKARVLAAGEVTSCKKLGTTTASVLGKVLGIDRPIESMTKELQTIARNSASNMGGDTIVPLTKIENGKQSYDVYKCVDPGS